MKVKISGVTMKTRVTLLRVALDLTVPIKAAFKLISFYNLTVYLDLLTFLCG